MDLVSFIATTSFFDFQPFQKVKLPLISFCGSDMIGLDMLSLGAAWEGLANRAIFRLMAIISRMTICRVQGQVLFAVLWFYSAVIFCDNSSVLKRHELLMYPWNWCRTGNFLIQMIEGSLFSWTTFICWASFLIWSLATGDSAEVSLHISNFEHVSIWGRIIGWLWVWHLQLQDRLAM